MSVLTRLLAKLQSLRAAIAKQFSEGKLPEKLRGILDRGREFLREKIPGARERLILGCAAAAVLVVLVLLGLLAAARSPRNTERVRPAAASAAPERSVIPPGDLFLPEEPDFLPGILLEREKRAAWTAEDAAQYWQDPLKDGEEPWRQHIEMAIDELMERVP